MKKLLLLLAFTTLSASAQTTIRRDNGEVRGYYTNAAYNNYEESVLLKPDGPCKINRVQVYLGGSTLAQKDTIRIMGDPAEGTLPPTQYTWSYNTLATFVVDYTGTPGWVAIDASGVNIRSDGYDRICIQHRNRAGGPRFAIDNDSVVAPVSSFLYDPVANNSQGYPGIYSYSQGDFLVRLEVVYDFPEGNSSAKAPYPSLLDITKGAKLVGSNGEPVKSSRVSVADWNNDGFDDVAIGGNFFENGKDGTFKDVSNKFPISASATVWGDYNNDGWLDAYAVDGEGDKIYRNNGNGTFTNITDATKFSNPHPTVTPIWLDYNRDGNLDIFIANGQTESGANAPDQLWRNNGDGTFKNVTAETEIALGEPTPLDCWGASAADFNNDGWVDIFVATAGLAPDRLFKNNGDGTFTEVGAQTGVHGVPTSNPNCFGLGVGCDWGDYNNDGFMDLAVGNFGYADWAGSIHNPSLVFKNNGGQNFTEVHKELGVKFFENNSGVMWADLDLDGNLDLWRSQFAYEPASETEPKRFSRVYMNGGAENNYAFKDKTWELGAEIHGAWTQARLDFDNDGDIDILAASPYDGVRLFRNDMARKGNWVGFESTSLSDNRILNSYDLSIMVYAQDKIFRKEMKSGGSGVTATQNSNSVIFGLGNINQYDSVACIYKGKRYSLLKNFGINQYFFLYSGSKDSMIYAERTYINNRATPAQLYPRNRQKIVGSKVEFQWKNTFSGRIQISTDSLFSSGVMYGGGKYMEEEKHQSFVFENPAKNTTYFWRVNDIGADYATPWSSVWSFTTGDPTSVENETSLGISLLKEATPNPVLNKTTISFAVEKAGEVSLKIFDVSGTEIATLGEGNFEPGEYSRVWNAENIPSGTYYYVLKTAAGSVTKKIVVAK